MSFGTSFWKPLKPGQTKGGLPTRSYRVFYDNLSETFPSAAQAEEFAKVRRNSGSNNVSVVREK